MTSTFTASIGDVHAIDLPDDSVDLVFCSPPYEDARTYGIDFKAKGDEWVEWAVAGYLECLRVSRGLVAWVVEGKTRNFRYSLTPMKLMVELDRLGVHMRKPPIYQRQGIPGSGGPDWLRNDYEFIVCGTNGGKLPWSDNAVMGKEHEQKWSPPRNRHINGERKTNDENYKVRPKANPGNVMKCATAINMGSKLCHENEAPFPEALAEFFIRSFCPPDGTVLDPFSGSGTTAAVALRHGRNAIAYDIRESQIELTRRRVAEVTETV